MANISTKEMILLEVTEQEFRLICHALTGGQKLRGDDRKAAAALGLQLMNSRSHAWRAKLEASEHAQEMASAVVKDFTDVDRDSDQ